MQVNGQSHQLELDPETPLLYVLRNDLGLKAAKYGCGSEICGACKVLIEGVAVPSCRLPLSHVAGLEITTLEGLGDSETLHPLQETFLEEQAAQCGFCTAGLIISAQGLLNRQRYPNDDDICTALANNLCRCGVYDRVRRAIKLRIGRPDPAPIYEVIPGGQLNDNSDNNDSNELPPCSPSLEADPQLDSWIRFNQDRSITVFSGKVELGQGIRSALAQIAAEELDVALERIRLVTADTVRTPDEGGTTGSRSLETSGVAIRAAAAEARYHLLSLAFEQLESLSPIAELQVKDGIISDPRSLRQTSYWQLAAGKSFDRRISGVAPLKDPASYQLVGKPTKRLDLLSKVSGGISYVHDLEPPNMLHARVLRPPSYHARLIGFPLERIRQLPGLVAVLQDGQFIALVAEREEVALSALEQARASSRWTLQDKLPPADAIYRDMLRKPAQSHLIIDGTASDEPPPPSQRSQGPQNAEHTIAATYQRPFQMHASLGPSAALALWDGDQLTVWSHSQAPFILRGALGQVLDLPERQIRVIHSEGAGCYGHNGADDAALDAALVARALPGAPIMLKWTRWDEHAWEPYGSAMLLELQASLSTSGKIIDWNHDIWSYSHSTRPALGLPSSGLLAARHLAQPFPPQEPKPMGGYHAGAHRNADPIYALPQKRILRHAIADSPLRVSALRSLGAYANIFAIESFMDELATAAAIDPLDFRLRHLKDERAIAVLRAAADKAEWASRGNQASDGSGWGMALAQYKNLQCYCAIIVQLQVDRQSGAIRFQRVIIAADAGCVVNPDGLSNQLEGGFTQAASWTLYEAVKFDADGITSVDWESYPILPFTAAPKIETLLINRPQLPYLGAGEAAQNPTPAAIANAIYAATGLRLRDIPFTPEKILAGLANS